MRYDLRPMSVGAILDRALSLYLRNFGILLAISLVFSVPVAALYLGLAALLGGDPTTEQLVSTFLALGVNGLVLTLLQGTLVKAISDIYLGLPVSLGGSLRLAGRRFLFLVVGSFLYSMITGMGTMCCILPGLYLMGALFAMTPVIMLERRGPIDALSRSWDLSGGMRRRAFGAIVFTGAIGAFVGWAVAFPAQLLEIGPFHAQAITHVAAALFQPYAAIVLILLYYDFRVRKEAFDLQVLAAELGRPAAAPPATGAAP